MTQTGKILPHAKSDGIPHHLPRETQLAIFARAVLERFPLILTEQRPKS